jgi:phosphate transport system permease protein
MKTETSLNNLVITLYNSSHMNIVQKERIDRFSKQLFKISGLLVIALLAGILIMLLYNSIAFFISIKPIDFFAGSQWNPASAPVSYSIIPL